MNNNLLSGKVIAVTGGSRRIGAKIVRLCHAAGANVLIHYHQSAVAAEALCSELNGLRCDSASTIAGDLRLETTYPLLLRAIAARWGRLDGVVNNASVFYPTPITTVSTDLWDDLLDVNLKAPFFLSLCLAPLLRVARGSIVNIADAHLTRPLREYSVYGIAKSALIMMTKTLAKELAPEIRVNAIAPGIIEWPEGDHKPSQRDQDKIMKEIALARMGTSDDIAQAVIFLLAQAAFITGEIIKIDGGRSLNW